MMQPSANGIAALFQGNPAALQQRVQKDQQAKPGLPPDLKELMALQILTEKTDAAQRQQAMNQLNQAGGPNMPTVAQTLQERAKQALQARMMQAQQQAQMPPQPQPIPTAPPQDQPEVSPDMMQQLAAMQAQGKGGLDQLQSNVGENYAGGGIIAFAGPTGSQVPKVGKEDDLPDDERARLERELEMRLIGELARNNPTPPEEPKPRVVSQIPPDVEGPALPRGIAGARNYVQFQPSETRPPVQNKVAPPAVSPAAPPQAPTGILTPEQASQVKQTMLDRLNLNPYERERLAREEAEKFIGAPETASLQTLADELAAKRQRLAKDLEANQGFDEYMRQIALAPRGLTSAAAGTYGAEAQRNRGKALEAQDFDTLQKMLETQIKISDVKRGWKKDLFTIGKAEFDKVYKDNYDAAKELGRSDAEAKKLAQEAVLERERMANSLASARIYTAPQLAANARTEKAIEGYKKANPKATDYEALMAVTQPNAYLAPDKQQLAELKVLAENLRAMTDPLKNPDVESQKEAARQLGLVTATIARMSGVELGGASTPPPGAVRLKK